MLIAPGGSLGGARPKASVVDEAGHLYIAKFPSVKDEYDVGMEDAISGSAIKDDDAFSDSQADRGLYLKGCLLYTSRCV